MDMEELLRIKSEKSSDHKTVIANINTILKAYEKGYRGASRNDEIPGFFAKNYSFRYN